MKEVGAVVRTRVYVSGGQWRVLPESVLSFVLLLLLLLPYRHQRQRRFHRERVYEILVEVPLRSIFQGPDVQQYFPGGRHSRRLQRKIYLNARH